MDFWLLYTIIMLPSLKAVVSIVMGILGIAGLFAAMFAIMSLLGEEEIPVVFKKACTYSAVVFGLAVSVYLVVPNENQMRYLIAGYYVTNIEGIENLPPQVVDTLNEVLAAIKAEMAVDHFAGAEGD